MSAMMKNIILVMMIFLIANSITHAEAKEMRGVIKKFSCADNCYLTIKTKRGEVEGLCIAKTACAPWFENQSMPKKYIGKSVLVMIGEDNQYDGNYSVVGTHLSFRRIRFLK
jgi:hypothetical protein